VEKVITVGMADDGKLTPVTGVREEKARCELEEFSGNLKKGNYSAFWQSQVRAHEMRRLWRVFNEEVLMAGWRGGLSRLWGLGWKNYNSIGRSFGEILGRRGKNRPK